MPRPAEVVYTGRWRPTRGEDVYGQHIHSRGTRHAARRSEVSQRGGRSTRARSVPRQHGLGAIAEVAVVHNIPVADR